MYWVTFGLVHFAKIFQECLLPGHESGIVLLPRVPGTLLLLPSRVPAKPLLPSPSHLPTKPMLPHLLPSTHHMRYVLLPRSLLVPLGLHVRMLTPPLIP